MSADSIISCILSLPRNRTTIDVMMPTMMPLGSAKNGMKPRVDMSIARSAVTMESISIVISLMAKRDLASTLMSMSETLRYDLRLRAVYGTRCLMQIGTVCSSSSSMTGRSHDVIGPARSSLVESSLRNWAISCCRITSVSASLLISPDLHLSNIGMDTLETIGSTRQSTASL